MPKEKFKIASPTKSNLLVISTLFAARRSRDDLSTFFVLINYT
ncbi:hypothetical protein HMPREF0693_0542 [Proteus mirabilis ATCC 29906]|nr:hypothetical protein HMPREF0693_0542 [Proteus mirabilis ATCC 29906]